MVRKEFYSINHCWFDETFLSEMSFLYDLSHPWIFNLHFLKSPCVDPVDIRLETRCALAPDAWQILLTEQKAAVLGKQVGQGAKTADWHD